MMKLKKLSLVAIISLTAGLNVQYANARFISADPDITEGNFRQALKSETLAYKGKINKLNWDLVSPMTLTEVARILDSTQDTLALISCGQSSYKFSGSSSKSTNGRGIAKAALQEAVAYNFKLYANGASRNFPRQKETWIGGVTYNGIHMPIGAGLIADLVISNNMVASSLGKTLKEAENKAKSSLSKGGVKTTASGGKPIFPVEFAWAKDIWINPSIPNNQKFNETLKVLSKKDQRTRDHFTRNLPALMSILSSDAKTPFTDLLTKKVPGLSIVSPSSKAAGVPVKSVKKAPVKPVAKVAPKKPVASAPVKPVARVSPRKVIAPSPVKKPGVVRIGAAKPIAKMFIKKPVAQNISLKRKPIVKVSSLRPVVKVAARKSVVRKISSQAKPMARSIRKVIPRTSVKRPLLAKRTVLKKRP
jgi:hypothetical protein